MLILPDEEICVAIMTNLEGCPGVGLLALNIAKSVYRNLEDIHAIN